MEAEVISLKTDAAKRQDDDSPQTLQSLVFSNDFTTFTADLIFTTDTDEDPSPTDSPSLDDEPLPTDVSVDSDQTSLDAALETSANSIVFTGTIGDATSSTTITIQTPIGAALSFTNLIGFATSSKPAGATDLPASAQPGSAQPEAQSPSDPPKSSAGAIAGGVIGAIVALSILAAVVFCLVRRHRRKRLDDKEDILLEEKRAAQAAAAAQLSTKKHRGYEAVPATVGSHEPLNNDGIYELPDPGWRKSRFVVGRSRSIWGRR